MLLCLLCLYVKNIHYFDELGLFDFVIVIYLHYMEIKTNVRLRSHRHEYCTGTPYTSSGKHEFACISVAAIHIDASTGYL